MSKSIMARMKIVDPELLEKIRKQTAEEIIEMLSKVPCEGNCELTINGLVVRELCEVCRYVQDKVKEIQKKYLEGK